jgi:hypothetical protein
MESRVSTLLTGKIVNRATPLKAPFVAELRTVTPTRGLPAVLAAVMLRGALRHDPGFFPDAASCPDDSCTGPCQYYALKYQQDFVPMPAVFSLCKC